MATKAAILLQFWQIWAEGVFVIYYYFPHDFLLTGYGYSTVSLPDPYYVNTTPMRFPYGSSALQR